MNRTTGDCVAKGKRFAIVVARFNRPLTERLVEGAVDCLTRHGADPDAIDVYDVPGTFEVPQLLAKLATEGRHDAFVALAVLIRGETIHFDCLAHWATGALGRIATEHGRPVANGIVTADTLEQAEARSGIKAAGKGWDAALAAVEMADLYARVGGA